MPRNVRNFWVEGSAEGKATPVGFGPRSKDGGISLTIKQRDNGEVTTALQVVGIARQDGSLVLTIYKGHTGRDILAEVITHR